MRTRSVVKQEDLSFGTLKPAIARLDTLLHSSGMAFNNNFKNLTSQSCAFAVYNYIIQFIIICFLCWVKQFVKYMFHSYPYSKVIY